ncbi:MAG: hypothetical protein K5989_01235 [Lachnospiraceae bacterium]|nr:hypothetical protein [Lachnospiraceae bacterium]
MRNRLLKAGVFLLTFIAALFLFSYFMNRGATETTLEMTEASFPTLVAGIGGEEVNLCHGYAGKRGAETVRGAITPLKEDRSADILVYTYGADIAGITYEVRSLDGTRLIESTEIGDFVEEDGVIPLSIRLKDLIQAEKEYLLSLILREENGRELFYYMRVIQHSDSHTEELLRFVLDFCRDTFDKVAAKRLTTYLESDITGDNSTYAHVNIHSNFEQITWGNLNIKPPAAVYPEILEMDSNTSSFRLRYTLSEERGEDTVWYDVEEFYRVRYSRERIYLLSYEREMRQVFDPERKDSFANDKIILGITDSNVNLLENEDGKTVAFEQNGALYGYRNTDFRAVRIFSFFRDGDDDERNRYRGHGIRILQVNETGDAHFIVYGYMNRGRHEGEVGVSVYYYNSSLNQIEEEIFIPYRGSEDRLGCDVEKLAYSVGGTDLYLYLNDSVLHINLSNQTCDVMADKVSFDALSVSRSGRTAACLTADGTGILLMDFHTGELQEIRKGGGTKVRPLGFVGEDFVYGTAREEDAVTNRLGVSISPMNAVYIEDSGGNLLKSYEKEGIFITGASIRDGEITLMRGRKSGEGDALIAIEEDTIVNQNESRGDKNTVETVVTEGYEKIVEIDLLSHINTASVYIAEPEEVLFEGARELSLPETEETDPDLMTVYSRGRIEGIYRTAYEAVEAADKSSGTVLDNMRRYIWQKGNRALTRELTGIGEDKGEKSDSLAGVVDLILRYEGGAARSETLLSQGMTAMEILESEISGAHALNLAGCDLSSVLYYVSVGNPVIARAGEGKYVLIVGYDGQNTVILDPDEGKARKKGMNDSKELFASYGNEFVSYVKE